MTKLRPLIFLILFVGCSSKGTNSGISEDQIMPAAVGNSWSYVDHPTPGFSGDTNIFTLSMVKDTVMSLTIDGATDIGHWFKVTGLAGAAPNYYTNRSNGYWQTFFYNDGTTTQIITSFIAKYPATIGDIYSRIYPFPFQNGSVNIEVISTGRTVTVPAGTFTCYLYRATLVSSGRLFFDSYFTPGVGLVKTSVYELTPSDSTVTRETRLTSYNVK